MTHEQLTSAKYHDMLGAAGGAGGKVVCAVLAPFTFGLSLLPFVPAAAASMNATYKIDIIDAELKSRNQYSRTRARDLVGGAVLGSVKSGISGGHYIGH